MDVGVAADLLDAALPLRDPAPLRCAESRRPDHQRSRKSAQTEKKPHAMIVYRQKTHSPVLFVSIHGS